ncbi:MAG: hypothetical protein AB1750_06570 [Chloroflexota bacterium]
MKKLFLFALTLALAGCSALQAAPTAAPQPTPIPPTAEVIVATVLVPVEQTVVVTKVVEPTAAPTDTPAPTLPPATATAGPTETTIAPTVASPSGPFLLDDNLGKGFFKNMSYSTNAFSLRCLVKSITFNVTAANDAINTVEFYYMIQDKNSIDISPWIYGTNMLPGAGAKDFTLNFQAEWIDPDWRRAETWFSFQFVGINRLGDRVGNSERFLRLIDYSNDCPE